MREDKMVFDYPLMDIEGQWVGPAQQYSYGEDSQFDIAGNPLSTQANPRTVRYSNRYIAPQEVYRRPALTDFPTYEYDQTARRSSGSTSTSAGPYSTSGEQSPTMRSHRPELR